jgi:hypothetical protein
MLAAYEGDFRQYAPFHHFFVSRNCASLSGPNSENMGFCIVELLDHAETTVAKMRFGAEN